MTDETTHPPLEEILEKIFGPVGHATPEQAYWPLGLPANRGHVVELPSG